MSVPDVSKKLKDLSSEVQIVATMPVKEMATVVETFLSRFQLCIHEGQVDLFYWTHTLLDAFNPFNASFLVSSRIQVAYLTSYHRLPSYKFSHLTTLDAYLLSSSLSSS
jgi:hypothetical protein